MKLKSSWVAALALAWCSPALCVLSGPGDIAFTGWNADGNDDFAFVILVDADAGQLIRFTDNEWDGATFSEGEGELTWTAPAGGLSAGTVVAVSDLLGTPTANIGTLEIVGTVPNIANSNEALFAIIGTLASPTAFLSAISSDGPSGLTTLTGTGLTVGVTAIDFNGSAGQDADIAAYTGVRSGVATFDSFLTLVNDPVNWVTQDGAGDQSNDAVEPDVPFDETPFSIDLPEPIFEHGFE